MKKSVRALRLAVLAALPLLWMAASVPAAHAATPPAVYSADGHLGAFNGQTGTVDSSAFNAQTGFFQQTPSNTAWSGPVLYAGLGGQFDIQSSLFTNSAHLDFSPLIMGDPGLAFYLPSNEVALWSNGRCLPSMSAGVCTGSSEAASQIRVSVPALYVLMPQDSKTDPTQSAVKNYNKFGMVAVAQQGGKVQLSDTYINVALPNYLAIQPTSKAGEPIQYSPSDIVKAWKEANTSPTIAAGTGGVINIEGKLITYSNLVPFIEDPVGSKKPKDFNETPAADKPVLANYAYDSAVVPDRAVGGITFSTSSNMTLSGVCSTSCDIGSTFSFQQQAPGVINLVLSDGSEFALHQNSNVTNLIMEGTTLYLSDIASARQYMSYLAAFKAGSITGAASVVSASYDYGVASNDRGVPSFMGDGRSTGYSGVVLRVEGDYISRGDKNTIVFNSYNGADAATDKLIVTGHVKGTTKVLVNNLKPGAKGLSDLSNKLIILVKGDKTEHGVESGKSELSASALAKAKAVKAPGQFVLANRVTQGAYEYFLLHSTLEDQGAHYDLWSLSNRNGTLTPEVGAYLNVVSNVNRLFLHDINDRTATASTPFTYRVWGSTQGQHNSWEDDDGQLSATNNSAKLMLGSDFYVSNTGEYVLHFGGFWGYGLINTQATSERSQYKAKAKTKGSSYGGYSTLYSMDEQGIASIFEIWFMRSQFNSHVEGQGTRFDDFKQSGSSYSVQYTRRFIAHTTQLFTERGGVYDQRQWVIAPSVQLAYLGNHFDAFKISNRGDVIAPIEGKTGNFMVRADIMLKVDDVQNLVYAQPVISRYLSLGYTHMSAPTQFLYDGDRITAYGARNLIQASAGFNARFADVWSADAKVQYSIGLHHYQQLDLNLGLQYAF